MLKFGFFSNDDIHNYIKSKNIKKIEAFLKKNKGMNFDLNCRDNNTDTALHLAIKIALKNKELLKQDLEIIKLLAPHLKANIRNRKNQTPKYLATKDKTGRISAVLNRCPDFLDDLIDDSDNLIFGPVIDDDNELETNDNLIVDKDADDSIPLSEVSDDEFNKVTDKEALSRIFNWFTSEIHNELGISHDDMDEDMRVLKKKLVKKIPKNQ